MNKPSKLELIVKGLVYLFIIAIVAFLFKFVTTPKEVEASKPLKVLEIKQLTDGQYPDNPDIGYMASAYSYDYFSGGSLELTAQTKGTFTFKSSLGDVILRDVDLEEYMPSAPLHLRSDAYLTELAVINQEWNRNQVKFQVGEFESNNSDIVRVDLARNCLNAYLWEVILYTNQEQKQLPLAHGWFDFPKDVYKNLFEQRNNLSYEDYRKSLENWIDPRTEKVNLDILRTVETQVPLLSFESFNEEMYPLEKARLKKRKEIIVPESFKSMKELQTDKTLLATFSPPGLYERSSPRKTDLGRLRMLSNIQVNDIKTATGQKSSEIVLSFTDQSKRETKLYFGGLEMKNFPSLKPEKANDGYKISMGFSNHTFYETYKEHWKWSALTSPYYGFFTNGKGEWLDSHKIGVDGPVFHWDARNPNLLHLWLLSFERHAFVGHYTIEFPKEYVKS